MPFGAGSLQSEDGTAAGALVNFGIGTRINEKFDLRLQVPTFFIPAGDVRDGGIVPTLTITAGLKFQGAEQDGERRRGRRAFRSFPRLKRPSAITGTAAGKTPAPGMVPFRD